MTDNTRFTLAKTGIVVAGVAGAMTLTACTGGTSKASGNLDDTRYVHSVPAATVPATRSVPVYSRKCETKTRQKTTGTGKFKKTTTESYQDCKNVKTGTRTERYTKTVKSAKSALYCVELDNVNGHRDDDDQWFEVDAGTFHKWAGRPEGTKIKAMPYFQKLFHCSH